MAFCTLIALVMLWACFVEADSECDTPIVVDSTPPVNASEPILESFVSYSIEVAFFPDYAGNSLTLFASRADLIGNLSFPNTFSNNLLNNIGNLTGTKPYLRVGGNTQDYAIYNASLPTSTYGIINPTLSSDYPTTLHIGPSYFESYATFPDTKYLHGFNLGLGGNVSHPEGWSTLLQTASLACKALEGGKLLWWEYGNEPDLYSTSAQGAVRPRNWNETTYVSQWLNGTRAIKEVVASVCPDMISDDQYGYMAPSFAGVSNHLNPVTTWRDDLDADEDVKIFSSHK